MSQDNVQTYADKGFLTQVDLFSESDIFEVLRGCSETIFCCKDNKQTGFECILFFAALWSMSGLENVQRSPHGMTCVLNL